MPSDASTTADSDSDSTPLPFVPQHPFDDIDADVILTSSDGIQFRLHSVVLSLLSSVFKTMFQLPQPTGEPQPIVLSEPAVVLDRMLRFCYPGAAAAVDSISHLQEILELALKKYDIQNIIPLAKVHLRMYIENHPVAAFAIACRHEWKDLAKAAAKETLKFPIRSFSSTDMGDLDCLTTHQYHSLLQYHEACATAAATTITNLRWITAPPAQTWFTCTASACAVRTYKWYLSDGELWSIRDWFLAYTKAAKKAVKARPLVRLDDPELMDAAVKGMLACSVCRKKGFQELREFASGALTPKIISKINKVALDLKF
ncbi:hypothetical protein C8R43DRAFT_914463 [Mycena crocata]|nr:hypothetical protein C8R43DRAFT_914463 [Mycena crocata]